MSFGIVVIIVGAVVLLLGALKMKKVKEIESYPSYQGLVTNVLTLKKGKQKYKVPMIQIEPEGHDMVCKQAMNVGGSRTYSENQKVEVKWSEKHPTHIYVEGDMNLGNSATFTAILGAVLVIAGIVMMFTM